MNVLFVCTGNTCRSVMAEYLLKHKLKLNQQLDQIHVQSAGIAALPGDQASKGAKNVLTSRGVSADAHQSRAINQDILNWADLILTMTSGHKTWIADLYPSACDKMFTLKEFLQDLNPLEGGQTPTGTLSTGMDHLDISDPFGGSHEEFDACANEIDVLLARLIHKLNEDASN